MGKEYQEQAESQKFTNTGGNETQVLWALVCRCNLVYNIYLETTKRVSEGEVVEDRVGAASMEKLGKGNDEHGGKERERGSRGVHKIGRKISVVFKLAGVRGRKRAWTTRGRETA